MCADHAEEESDAQEVDTQEGRKLRRVRSVDIMMRHHKWVGILEQEHFIKLVNTGRSALPSEIEPFVLCQSGCKNETYEDEIQLSRCNLIEG
jgi:hypothetical protein